uniref:hypothetical protein n=1 Tax=Cryobacterium sp. Y50 TaxID=2048286 RepID=UPI000CE3AE40|nr:hypothetical protein [Cryobacterium sp. Y50]
MTTATWRDEWSPFRVKLIDETAGCLADQQSAVTGGERPRWGALTHDQQENIVENIAGIFLAMDQAMQNLADRGEIA